MLQTTPRVFKEHEPMVYVLGEPTAAPLAPNATPRIVTAAIEALFDSAVERLVYLYGRWLDERQYEDWSEYEAALRAIVTADSRFNFVRATRSPFTVEFTVYGAPAGAVYRFFVNSRDAGWNRVPAKA